MTIKRQNDTPILFSGFPWRCVRTFFTDDIVLFSFIVDHDKDAEKIHNGREYGHQHNFGIRQAGQFCHNESACAHDRRHEHPADGSCRFDTAGNVRLETGLFHHGDGKCTGGNRIGDGAA